MTLGMIHASADATNPDALRSVIERRGETYDNMIFNLAFLVRRAGQAAFGERVLKLAMRHAERIEFRFVGPAPAYNFSGIPTGWLQPEPLLGAA